MMHLHQFDTWKEWSPLAIRLVAGILFIMAGYNKLFVNGASAFAGMLEGWGFPLAAVLAWIVALVEFLGGIALVLGLLTRVSAILLGVTMLVAWSTHLVHAMDGARLPILLVAAMASLLLSGGGKLALDEKLCKERSQK